ncbi:TPA: fimbrial protein [Escherichia coli]|nr:fimbrial protein [Escherichia coli]HBA6843019.1 fimbrial protein [Escherichia coli]HBA6856620.1 fimbrial protein [Escherichia coli]HBA8714816.1 fimbrial protein [Escherichia coli]HBA8941835.1 fimbrial protein [Escherichia coli]
MKMKKTMIALAFGAITASGSAMAWVEGGSGGSVDLGGTITPDTTITSPWEVKVGSALTGLDAQISAGATSASVTVPGDSLVLGVRSKDGWFTGAPGIAPQLDYHGAVSGTYSRGATDLTLDVKDANTDQTIGSLTTKLTTAAMGSTRNATAEGHYMLAAANAGDAFFGGLGGVNASQLYGDPQGLAARVDSTVTEHYETAGSQRGIYTATFGATDAQYNAFYLSALETANAINIQLDNPVTSDVSWKASLPVTVTYQ